MPAACLPAVKPVQKNNSLTLLGAVAAFSCCSLSLCPDLSYMACLAGEDVTIAPELLAEPAALGRCTP